jgi:hypothetical protein
MQHELGLELAMERNSLGPDPGDLVRAGLYTHGSRNLSRKDHLILLSPQLRLGRCAVPADLAPNVRSCFGPFTKVPTPTVAVVGDRAMTCLTASPEDLQALRASSYRQGCRRAERAGVETMNCDDGYCICHGLCTGCSSMRTSKRVSLSSRQRIIFRQSIWRTSHV